MRRAASAAGPMTMSKHSPRILFFGALLAIFSIPAPGHAFPGFYVTSAGTDVFSRATTVVLMREGTTTVLSVQSDYDGPPEHFVIVLPVPARVGRDNVRTLPRDLFERIERLAAPRLVEYWEQDPCDREPPRMATTGVDRSSRPLPISVEAEFAVGEYDVVMLELATSSALDQWLRREGYRAPEGARSLADGYFEAGARFLAARVNVDRAQMEDGRLVLAPLRVHYESEELWLPIRPGLLNSPGTQDLIVNILARNRRYEVANRPNVTIPTNIEVTAETRGRFGEFFAALFDRTLARNPGAAVTEYAWFATHCDPCPPGAQLQPSDLMTLGGDVARASPTLEHVVSVRLTEVRVRGAIETGVARRAIRLSTGVLRSCYEEQLEAHEDLAGSVDLTFAIGATGLVSDAAITRSELENPQAEDCIMEVVRGYRFAPQRDASSVTATVAFSARSSPRDASYNPLGEHVLTRLHLRYRTDDVAADLVFRPARAIAGGREVPNEDGGLEQGARRAAANAFQGRYVIRHPWDGPIECAQPTRGNWGAIDGADDDEQAGVAVATDLAFAPRDGMNVARFMTQDVPELGLTRTRPQPRAEPELSGRARAPSTTGCHCRCQAPARSSNATWLAAAFFLFRWSCRARPRRRRTAR